MIPTVELIGVACVLLTGCILVVALVVGAFIVPVRALGRRRRASRTAASRAARAARDAHAAAVREYCLISPDYALAITLLHEGDLTDLLGLAAQLRTHDRQDDEDEHADL